MPHRELIAAVRAAWRDRNDAHARYVLALTEAIAGGVTAEQLAGLTLGPDGRPPAFPSSAAPGVIALELERMSARRPGRRHRARAGG